MRARLAHVRAVASNAPTGRLIRLRRRRVRSFDDVDRPTRRRNPYAQWSGALRHAFERVVVRSPGSPGCRRAQVFPVRIARRSDARGLDRSQSKLPFKRPRSPTSSSGGECSGGAMAIGIGAMRRPIRRRTEPASAWTARATAIVSLQHARNAACDIHEVGIDLDMRSGGTATSQRALRICAMCNTRSVTDCPNVGCGRAWTTQSSAHQRRA